MEVYEMEAANDTSQRTIDGTYTRETFRKIHDGGR